MASTTPPNQRHFRVPLAPVSRPTTSNSNKENHNRGTQDPFHSPQSQRPPAGLKSSSGPGTPFSVRRSGPPLAQLRGAFSAASLDFANSMQNVHSANAANSKQITQRVYSAYAAHAMHSAKAGHNGNDSNIGNVDGNANAHGKVNDIASYNSNYYKGNANDNANYITDSFKDNGNNNANYNANANASYKMDALMNSGIYDADRSPFRQDPAERKKLSQEAESTRHLISDMLSLNLSSRLHNDKSLSTEQLLDNQNILKDECHLQARKISQLETAYAREKVRSERLELDVQTKDKQLLDLDGRFSDYKNWSSSDLQSGDTEVKRLSATLSREISLRAKAEAELADAISKIQISHLRSEDLEATLGSCQQALVQFTNLLTDQQKKILNMEKFKQAHSPNWQIETDEAQKLRAWLQLKKLDKDSYVRKINTELDEANTRLAVEMVENEKLDKTLHAEKEKSNQLQSQVDSLRKVTPLSYIHLTKGGYGDSSGVAELLGRS